MQKVPSTPWPRNLVVTDTNRYQCRCVDGFCGTGVEERNNNSEGPECCLGRKAVMAMNSLHASFSAVDWTSLASAAPS